MILIYLLIKLFSISYAKMQMSMEIEMEQCAKYPEIIKIQDKTKVIVYPDDVEVENYDMNKDLTGLAQIRFSD